MDQMIKFMRQLRIKKEVLKQNVAFMKEKRAVQHWFQRTQVTLYLRRRNAQVIKNYRQTKLRRMIKGWKEMLKEERKGGEMMARFLARMQFFDQAKAF
jgi:flavoprotein